MEVDDPARFGEQGLSARGEGHEASAAFYERRSDDLLQAPYVLAHGRLAEVKGRRRSVESAA
ncbi:hypothetical protein GCM10009651_02950 [Microbacterium natoriense]